MDVSKGKEKSMTLELILEKPHAIPKIKLISNKTITNLGKAIISACIPSVDQTTKHLLEFGSEVGLSRTPGQLAWVWIEISVVEALKLSLRNASEHIKDISEESLIELMEPIQATWLEIISRSSIDEKFFNNPSKWTPLDELKEPLKCLLIELGWSELISSSIFREFKIHFVYRLLINWKDQSSRFLPIRDFFDNPISKSSQYIESKQTYKAWLTALPYEKVFGENFSLLDIYISLRCMYYGDSSKKNLAGIEDVSVYIHKWLNSQNPQDSIKFICGQAGTGKSSFAKILVSELAKDNKSVIFIPVHHLHFEGSLINALQEYFKLNPHVPSDLLSEYIEEKDLVIVLDGLDEISLHGEYGESAARKLIQEMKRFLNIRNEAGQNIKAIVTGRKLAVQSLDLENYQCIDLLNYLITHIFPNDEFEDQRLKWWQKYGALKGQNYNSFPFPQNNLHLRSLTAVPLLNYLVALGISTGTLTFTEETSISDLYDALLIGVYERRYEGGGKKISKKGVHAGVEHWLNVEEFIMILEEIAIAMWMSDGSRTASLSAIKAMCEESKIDEVLKRYQYGVERGLYQVLTAFYSKRADLLDSESRYELTHKSFGEYLVAKRLTRELNKLSELNGLKLSSCDHETLILESSRILGKINLTKEVLDFIQAGLGKENIELLNRCQTRFGQCVKECIDKQQAIYPFIEAHLSKKNLFLEEDLQDYISLAQKTQVNMLFLLSLFGFFTGRMTNIDFEKSTQLGNWLNSIFGQVVPKTWPLSGIPFLSYLNIVDQSLSHHNFIGVKIVGSAFKSVNANSSDFSQGLIKDCSFEDCSFFRTDFGEVDFVNVSFSNTSLVQCGLYGCTVENCTFERTNLCFVDFEQTEFKDTIFRGINRLESEGIKFENAKFINAYLFFDLEHVLALSREQIESAWIHPSLTKLPSYLESERDEIFMKQQFKINLLKKELGDEVFSNKYPLLMDIEGFSQK